jgi:hypothetical protein
LAAITTQATIASLAVILRVLANVITKAEGLVAVAAGKRGAPNWFKNPDRNQLSGLPGDRLKWVGRAEAESRTAAIGKAGDNREGPSKNQSEVSVRAKKKSR